VSRVVVDEEKVEEVANRILSTFGTDVRSDAQFDALCDIVEGALKTRHLSANLLCRQIAKANFPEDVTVATLLTLLKDPFAKARDKVASAPQKKRVRNERGYEELKL
jgi:hypothetical protein